jgi:hypothetical protein
VRDAGFEIDDLDAATGLIALWHPGPGGSVIDLDLLTDAPDPRTPIEISGQPGLVVPGYPDQHVLLENARWIEVGANLHPALDPPIRVRVPTLAAYVLVKALSSARRPGESKRAKDLVYLVEVVRDAEMRREVVEDMPGLAERHPAEYAGWRAALEAASADRRLLEEVAEQLLAQSRAIGELSAVATYVAAQFRRLLAETPQPRAEGGEP